MGDAAGLACRFTAAMDAATEDFMNVRRPTFIVISFGWGLTTLSGEHTRKTSNRMLSDGAAAGIRDRTVVIAEALPVGT
jgi:hypothetical protein